MNWILIVLVSGNIHFTTVTSSEEQCLELGNYRVEDNASFVCLSSEKVHELIQN